MAIDCEVVPRPGAKPDALKALGAAVLRWYVRECHGEGIAHSVDTEALIELLNGRLPAPRVPRPSPAYVPSGAAETAVQSAAGLNGYELRAPDVEQLREALAEAQRPAVLLRVRERNYDRDRTIASLRDSILSELVHDVCVDGRSWDGEGQ